VEQGQAYRATGAAKAQGDLGHPHSPAARPQNTRSSAIQSFNLAIDSKLRGCDLVGLRVCDIAQGGRVATRAIVMQGKTHRPVQFELTEQTRKASKPG